jgi:hypothetical protein
MLDINLLQFQAKLRLAKQADTTFVYDPIRKKDIVLLPEELVRQLVLLYFLEHKAYPANRLRVEIGIELNGLKKRCDIVVFDGAVQPWLLVECKSPKVAVDHKVFEQAARYNLQLRAPYLLVTNGLTSYCAQLDFENGSFEYLSDLPDF